MTQFRTDEEMSQHCADTVAAAKASNPDMTEEQVNDLIGDIYMDAMSEFFPSDGDMLDFVKKSLGEMENDTQSL
jgi:hypothetical protein